MKFKDLEIGQTFRFGGGETTLCTKSGSTTFTYDYHGIDRTNHTKRDANVAPEGEPPSAIAAAKRDARWYVLADMDARIKIDMGRAGSGTVREIQRQNLLGGLDVLRAEMITNPENLDQVLHDLIEIVRELV